MANPSVLEELKKFIPYAVKNSTRKQERKQFGDENWINDFEDTLIKIYMSGVRKRKTDKALCEYAKSIAESNGVELPESIKYFIFLMKL